MACAAPGQFLGCGICNSQPGDCQLDNECDTGKICEPVVCACGLSGPTPRVCTPGCSTTNPCPIGQTCGSGFHCAATPCSGSCPANFTCTEGACERTPCKTDKDCDGVCVGSSCYDQLGACEPIPV